MDPGRFKRALLSLGDAPLRVEWVQTEVLRLGFRNAAPVLNAIAEESEAAEPSAREALLSVALVLVNDCNGAILDGLRHEAARQELFALERLVRRGPPSGIHAPPPDELHVPDYGRGRELTLGERKSLARRPNRNSFEKLCLDPHPLVIRQLLENPKMVEDDAIRIATIRPARVDAIRELARSHRWMSRPRVRMAVILNPGSPPEVAIPLLALCNREELRDALRSTETSLTLRATAQEFFARRPPMPRDETTTVH